MLVLTAAEVEELLEPAALVEAIAGAMADVSAGRTSQPPRVAAEVPVAEGILAAMPAHVPSASALAAKLVTLFPHNTDVPTHAALVAVFDAGDGSPVALLEGASLTALRTAAGSALATRLLARPDASTVAVLGTGVQAEAHARVLARVRRVDELRIAGRRPARAEALAHRLRERDGLPAAVAATYADACRGAGIVCAATHSPEPVVRRGWLAPGSHVNSVGFPARGGEVAMDVYAAARVVVESRAAALAPYPAGAGDLRLALESGELAGDAIAELGELVLGSAPGRAGEQELTVYKSVGVAAQDAAAAALALAEARRRGVGREMDL